jgi:hypothetical protein
VKVLIHVYIVTLSLLLICSGNCRAQHPTHSIKWVVEPEVFFEKCWKDFLTKKEFKLVKKEKLLKFGFVFDRDSYEIIEIKFLSLEIMAEPENPKYTLDKSIIEKIETAFEKNLKIADVTTIGYFNKEDPLDSIAFISLRFYK